jgi:hypothetical protein
VRLFICLLLLCFLQNSDARVTDEECLQMLSQRLSLGPQNEHPVLEMQPRLASVKSATIMYRIPLSSTRIALTGFSGLLQETAGVDSPETLRVIHDGSLVGIANGPTARLVAFAENLSRHFPKTYLTYEALAAEGTKASPYREIADVMDAILLHGTSKETRESFEANVNEHLQKKKPFLISNIESQQQFYFLPRKIVAPFLDKSPELLAKNHFHVDVIDQPHVDSADGGHNVAFAGDGPIHSWVDWMSRYAAFTMTTPRVLVSLNDWAVVSTEGFKWLNSITSAKSPVGDVDPVLASALSQCLGEVCPVPVPALLKGAEVVEAASENFEKVVQRRSQAAKEEDPIITKALFANLSLIAKGAKVRLSGQAIAAFEGFLQKTGSPNSEALIKRLKDVVKLTDFDFGNRGNSTKSRSRLLQAFLLVREGLLPAHRDEPVTRESLKLTTDRMLEKFGKPPTPALVIIPKEKPQKESVAAAVEDLGDDVVTASAKAKPVLSKEGVRLILDYLSKNTGPTSPNTSGGVKRCFFDAIRKINGKAFVEEYRQTINNINFPRMAARKAREGHVPTIQKLSIAWKALLKASPGMIDQGQAVRELTEKIAAATEDEMPVLERAHLADTDHRQIVFDAFAKRGLRSLDAGDLEEPLAKSFTGVVMEGERSPTSPEVLEWTLLSLPSSAEKGRLRPLTVIAYGLETGDGLYVKAVYSASDAQKYRFFGELAKARNLKPLTFELKLKGAAGLTDWEGTIEVSPGILAKLSFRHGMNIDELPDFLSRYKAGESRFDSHAPVGAKRATHVKLVNGPYSNGFPTLILHLDQIGARRFRLRTITREIVK